MSSTTLSAKELLQAGIHYGHRVSRWNPKMKPYIFGKRNLIHILDIRETLRGLSRAYHFIKNLSARGETILFVGTKRQARSVIMREARRCGMPFVAERWLGGCLTNHATIRTRLKRLAEIESLEQKGVLATYPKKEISKILREKRKLFRNLDGIRNMQRLPTALFVIDPMQEKISVEEANRVGLVTIGLADTDCDPDRLDVVVPGNDDSMRVISLVVARMAEAVLEGKAAIGAAIAQNEAARAAVQQQNQAQTAAAGTGAPA